MNEQNNSMYIDEVTDPRAYEEEKPAPPKNHNTAKRVHRVGWADEFALVQDYTPWANCGFNSKHVEVVFHPRSDGGLNFELEITETIGKQDRIYSKVGSLSLSPETATALMDFLCRYL